MNSMRKFVGLVMVMLLAAFTLPVIAADKNFSIQSPGNVPVTTTSIAVTFVNGIAGGNSTFNSLELGWSVTGPATVAVTGITNSQGKPINSRSTPDAANPGQVIITNLNPVTTKNGSNAITLTLAVTLTNNTCTTTQIAWTGKAYTGSPTSPSQPFVLTSAPPTTINPGCTLGFVTNPISAMSGAYLGSDANPVKVQASPAGMFSGKTVTLAVASGPSGATLTNYSATISPAGYAAFPGLTLSGAVGQYQLGAATNVSGGPTATSAAFNITDSDGVLDCVTNPNGGIDSIPAQSNGAGTTVSGNRGLNKDGSVCKLVVYDLALIGDRTFQFKWDTANQGTASFAYQAAFAPTPVDPLTGLPKPIKLAWTANGVTPNYVQGRACLSSALPAPYGTLITDNTATITVNVTSLPPSGAFDVVIGTDRLTVVAPVALGTSTWTVNARGVGGTTGVTHTEGSFVMSTPFPLDASDIQMPMCIADYFYAVTSPGQVSVSARIFDEGDGWVDQP